MSRRIAGLNAAKPAITSNTISSSCGPGMSSAIPSSAATHAGTWRRVAAMIARAVRSTLRVNAAMARASARTVSASVDVIPSIIVAPRVCVKTYAAESRGNCRGRGPGQKSAGRHGGRHPSGGFPPVVKKHSFSQPRRSFKAYRALSRNKKTSRSNHDDYALRVGGCLCDPGVSLDRPIVQFLRLIHGE